MNNTATNTATCPTVRKQIGKTTYIVRVHFSETAKETMEDKIKRMLREEVRKMWLLFEFDEKVLDFSSLEMLPQIILATIDYSEYDSEIETPANIIVLTEKRKLLNESDYVKNQDTIMAISELLKKQV